MSHRIVAIGELLWDLLPGGRQLGGAPGNFACHAAALGANACLVSRVGDDALGREAVARLVQRGLPAGCIEVDPKRATGTVGVELSPDGQPHFDIHRNVAWDCLRGEAAGRAAAAAADVVCFGSLAQRSEPSRSTIRSLVAMSRPTAWRIFDINLRQDYYSVSLIVESLHLANVLKVNETELPRIAELFGLGGDLRAQIEELARRHALHCVAYTRGGAGSLLFAEGRWSEHPGFPTSVVDTVGAGDSFTAVLALGLLNGWELDRINDLANRVAAYVCSHAGATPTLPRDLAGAFDAAG